MYDVVVDGSKHQKLCSKVS